MTLRRTLAITLTIVLLAVTFAAGWLTGRSGIGSVVDANLTDAERQFIGRMRDVALVGTFTVTGRPGSPKPDRYEIRSVEKVGEDLWRFNAKLDCCGVQGAIPIVVPMRWSGDTPMIMMTDTSLPGIGTFTVRLFFYGEEYAGTWVHGKVGGHMSGRIEQLAAAGPR